jgi:hypothetical protein
MTQGATDGRGKGEFVDTTYGIEEAFERYDIADEVYRMLGDLGITNPDKPVLEEAHAKIYGLNAGEHFDGRMPPLVGKLSLDQLSALYNLFQNWYAYISGQLGIWRTRRQEAKRKKEIAAVSARRRYTFDSDGAKNPEQVIKDLAAQDQYFIDADSDFELASAMFNILEAHAKITSNNMKMISREVTIRGLEIENNARNRGFQGRTVRAFREEESPPVGMFENQESDHDENQLPRKAKEARARPRARAGTGRVSRSYRRRDS